MNQRNDIRKPLKRSTAFLILSGLLLLYSCASTQRNCTDGGCENGMGVLELEDGSSYYGNFRSSERDGLGKIIYANQDTFDGTFESNVKQGRGILKYANGHRFEGNYTNGMRFGSGKYYYSDIEFFEGNYEEGFRTGIGTYTYPNGDKFVGEYRGGRRNGPGRYTFADKNILEGIWIDNLLEGKAIIKNPKGRIIHEGFWKNGKYLGMENPSPESSDRVEIPNS